MAVCSFPVWPSQAETQQDLSRSRERYFGTALRTAAEQGVMVYRLIAGTLLSWLFAEEGRRKEAKAVLDRANANPLSLSMARGCARINSRLDTVKIGPAGRIKVNHARLLAIIWVRKTFLHGLDPKATSTQHPSNHSPPQVMQY